MKSPTPTELLSDFINLSWGGWTYCKSFGSKLIDKKLADLVITRQTRDSFSIHYLYSGSSVNLPWHYLDLFGYFAEHSGDKLFSIYSEIDDEWNTIDKTIYIMTEIAGQIKSGSQLGQRLLDLLGELCVLGTRDLKAFIRNFELGCTIPDVTYISSDRILII